MFRQVKLFFWETLEVVLISLAIILPIRYFLVQPFFVKGQSMEPVFQDGDYLIVDEISFRFREPDRGEVIVFRFPQQPSQFYIKRIVALPSETVEVRGGRVKVYSVKFPQGFFLEESYLAGGEVTEGDVRLTLGKGEYFVLGDNRRASYDSRRWGVVPRRDVIGRVWIRPWPLPEATIFTKPAYE